MKSVVQIILGFIIFILITCHLFVIGLLIGPTPKLVNLVNGDIDYVYIGSVPQGVINVFPVNELTLESNGYLDILILSILDLKFNKFFDSSERQELYLNTLDFGGGIVGIESASNYYFNKSVKELSFDESIMLINLYKVFIQ